ncbi:hypothetical protein [Actinoplanes sp. M2I2]|uniref:hypothetical protein n=1 Tax=Actinoplanes sp. M2I2 TaxID=1734444 RepID=UPI0020201AB1|nr:hypothetical protein [Actinoplanes sp. M2I2]
MRQRMQSWAGNPTLAESGIAVGVVLVFVVVALVVSPDTMALNPLQLIGVMVAVALLVVVVLKVLTSLRSRRSRR